MPESDAKDGMGETEFVQVETPRTADEEKKSLALQVATSEAETKDHESESGSSQSSKKANAPTSYKFTTLYRFATPYDKFLLTIGVILASCNGALMPVMAIVFGNVMQDFAVEPIDQHSINSAALKFFYLAIVMFVLECGSYITFHYTAERQMQALRGEALKHMMYMDIAWYDKQDALQLSSRITGDTIKIKDGMGQKLGQLFRFSCQFIVGFIVGFIKGWDVTLCMCAILPFMAFSMSWLIKSMQQTQDRMQKVYAEAGAVAEETLGQMRTVASLNGEKRAIAKYGVKTLNAEKENIHLMKMVSWVLASFVCSIFVMYSIGLWYGGKKVSDKKSTPGEVFQAFFGVMMGSGSLAQISPNLTAIAQATGSAQAIFNILDTPSAIDAANDDGIVPESCEGAIEVHNVHFAYPARPDAPILVDYNLDVKAGETVAFVGTSGCGKSTLVSLLERFYNPQQGHILLDGHDITDINVKWLRRQIGIVQQEPVLFAMTIYENIAAGGQNVTRDQAIEAAKMSNAHNFIMSMPQQYDTLVGEKGVSLSGGQKQRIAIARAIVRNPKILVLDEATSALDNESERIVQSALNDLMDKTNMTTLLIAHRLSTVRHADKIVVLRGGHIVETGKHEELMAKETSLYKTMYKMQELKTAEDEAQEAQDAAEASIVSAPLSRLSRRSSTMSTSTDYSVKHVESNDIETPEFSIWDVVKFSTPEKKYFVRGVIGAIFGGSSMPASALLMAGMMTTMTQQYGRWYMSVQKGHEDASQLHDMYHDVRLYGIGYLCIAVFLFGLIRTQFYSFKYMMEKLVTRLRDMNFAALCRQNIGFFDKKENGTGALTADLNTNATKVSLLSGDSLGNLLQGVFCLISAIVISFATGSWQLSLIMVIVLPLLVFGQYLRQKQVHGKGAFSDELAVPGAHASEHLCNIRTVAALGLEESASTKFMQLLEEPMKKGKSEARINGVSLGFSSFIFMAAYAVGFAYSGHLVSHNSATFGQVMRSLMSIMMSIQGITGATSYFTDSESAIKAGATIVGLRDRKVPIDSFDESGETPASVEGHIEFKKVSFRYPTRPEVSVLKRYNLTIESGQTVAFCGPSGGGKSTVVSLLERYYDPICGEIELDGKPLKSLNVNWLRSQIGLVGQEPVLFLGTIAENIGYGLPQQPSQEEIEAAAKMSNAHKFIMQFPDGYQTQVGNKGEQLSGGQKQRIAIARAILKDPPILILDEATSALDSESEKIVQEALDNVVALKKRTTIIIAHRLSTIRNADKICVVSGGHIAEQGTHTELLAKKGIYAGLVEMASA